MSGSDLCNVLVARQHTRPIEQDALRRYGPAVRLLIDSGAFTDFTSGAPPMDVLEFAAWARRIRSEVCDHMAEFAGFVTLDVIGDARATRRNYEALLDLGIDVLPVITTGAADTDIDRYLDTSDYIFIGGIAKAGAAERKRVREMEARLPDTHRRHWLGFTRHDYVAKYRPASIDSSNVTSTYRYPTVDIVGRDGRVRTRDPRRLTAEDRRSIRRMGFDPADIAAPIDNTSKTTTGSSSAHGCLTTAAHLEYARRLRRYMGTRYYLATGTWVMSTVRVLQMHLGGPCLPSLTRFELNALLHYGNLGRGIVTLDELPEHRTGCPHGR